MTWLIVTASALTYFVGFVVVVAVVDRTFYGFDAEDDWFIPTFWPLGLAIALFVAPWWVATKGGRWLASRETPAERRDRLAVERDKRVREQAATIARLEREAGIR